MKPHRAVLRLPDGSEHTVEVRDDEHVLDAALAAGLDLPYSCQQGWCLTCAARLIEGSVNQQDSRRYYAADREAGFILPCTARPESDVTIETHARAAMRANRDRHRLPYPKGDWGG